MRGRICCSTFAPTNPHNSHDMITEHLTNRPRKVYTSTVILTATKEELIEISNFIQENYDYSLSCDTKRLNAIDSLLDCIYDAVNEIWDREGLLQDTESTLNK